LTIPRSIKLNAFLNLLKELEDFCSTLLPDCPLNVRLNHLVIDLDARRLPSEDHELLGVLFEPFRLLQEHEQLHESDFMNIEVVLYNHVSYQLTKSYWILIINSNIDDLVKQYRWDILLLFKLSYVLSNFLEMFFIWSYC